MGLPRPAAICLGVGSIGLLLVVVNQLTAGLYEPALTRAGVLASLLAVGLMLVAVLWTRALPEAAPVEIVNVHGLGARSLPRSSPPWRQQPQPAGRCSKSSFRWR